METAIISVVCIALMVIGGMTMSQSFLSSVDTTTISMEQASSRYEKIMRTDVTMVSATLVSSGHLDVRLRNSGQTKLSDYDKWDVIVQYYDDSGIYYVKWLPYTDWPVSDNEWGKEAIYDGGGGVEAFEPNILNPSEEILIEVRLGPVVGRETTNMVVVSTPNGISASTSFVRN